MNPFQAGALLLPLDHLDDQLFHVGVAHRLDVPGLDRTPVGLDRAPLCQLIELWSVYLDQDPLILREVLSNVRARHLDPVELDVTPALQFEPEDEFEFLQSRDFGLKALDRGPDQLLG